MRTLSRFSLLVLCACAALAAATPASAAPTVSDFLVPTGTPGAATTSSPQDIVQGPDGNIWFVENSAGKLGKVVPGNPPTITDYPAPAPMATAQNIALGPDNHLWFTGGQNVAEADPANPAGSTAHGGIGLQDARGIAAGPDGNLWIVDLTDNEVQRVDTAGAAFGTNVALGGTCAPRNITRGPDNNMWVTCFGSGQIARIPPGSAPTATLFNLPAGTTPWDIVTGPDGNLWYTGQKHDVGRITTAGASKNFPSAGLDPFGITAGPDGALWYAQNGENNIGRMTTAGTASQIGGLTAIPDGASPRYITPGPGNTLWFTEDFGNRIGRITGIDIPGGGGGGGTTTDTTRPGVSALGMTDTTVVVGPGGTPLTGTAAATTGTTIRYTLSEAATVRLRFERKLAGRRVKKGKKRICAKPTRKNRKKRKCTRYKLAGTLTRSSKQGKNSVKFSGRIGKKALKRGSYRLVVTATDAAGNKSKAKSLSFRVVKAAKRKRR